MNLNFAPLDASDIGEADRIFRVAFGTRNGLSDPMRFDGDAARVKTRILAPNVIGLGARDANVLVAVAMATIWGSYAWLGPLAVLPEYWNAGIGQRLLPPILTRLEAMGTRHMALFTVAESAKHVSLYRKFGFWPGFLTLLMRKDTNSGTAKGDIATWSVLSVGERMACARECRTVTELLYPGLDLSAEIGSVSDRSIGDTVLLIENARVTGFAVCHFGPGTEAESATAYVKFAAVRPGPNSARHFAALIEDCESLAARRGLKRIIAGVNTSRRLAYDVMEDQGFRSIQQGVAMHRPDETGYDRPELCVVDDLR